MQTIIGRNEEIKLIEDAHRSKKAELIIVYGRRRVGKSFLLKKICKNKNGLYFEGLQGESSSKQIKHFLDQLSKQLKLPRYNATTWPEAFDIITQILKEGSWFVVFDELPWMACERSTLISYLKYYWDNHWKENNKLSLALCGSVAAFMVKHVIHSKALHNRKTLEINLLPLVANQSKSFFNSKRPIGEIIRYLMTFGGIPKYLEQIDLNSSYNQNINKLCFHKHGFFVNEFETLFKEQFKVYKYYENICEKLAFKSQSKESLAKSLSKASGGGLSLYLQNLEKACFIKKIMSLHSQTSRYVLDDPWLRFYFFFIKKNIKLIQNNQKSDLFEKITEKNANIYFGFCFERFIANEIEKLLEILNIHLGDVIDFGPIFKQGARRRSIKSKLPATKASTGYQIDLLIERKQKLLTLIECKWSQRPVGIEIIAQIETKEKLLLKDKSKMFIERVLICSNGATTELKESDFFHRIIEAQEFFTEKN